MAETQQQKLERLAAGKFINWREKRQYETGAMEYPKGWQWLDLPKFADYYPKESIREFIQTAKKHKLDPNDLLALGIAESGLGLKHPDNPIRVNVDVWDDVLRRRYPQLREIKDISEHPEWRGISLDFGAGLVADALKKYQDRISAFQSYSGRGKYLYGGPKRWAMTPGVDIGKQKFFGKPSEEINFWRDKPQGKRVEQLSIWLRANDDLQQLIDKSW